MKVSIFLLFARAHHNPSHHIQLERQRELKNGMLIQRLAVYIYSIYIIFSGPLSFHKWLSLSLRVGAHVLVCACSCSYVWVSLCIGMLLVCLVLCKFRIKLSILLCHRYTCIQNIHYITLHTHIRAYICTMCTYYVHSLSLFIKCLSCVSSSAMTCIKFNAITFTL